MLITHAFAQQMGTVKKNEFVSFSMTEMGKSLKTAVVLDANWRWIHNVGGYDNCYTNDWNKQYCPDPMTCSKNCALEGVNLEDYKNIYGISSSGDSLTLRYVTNGNVGSRLFLLDESNTKYKGFNLINKELVFEIDVSKLPCGLNGAIYLVEMPLDGGMNQFNKAGARYGTGYGDAQCPTDIKYINGFVNTNSTGVCSIEMDIWEANSAATQIAPHTCKEGMSGVTSCITDQTCGRGAFRYQGNCDKDGSSYNSYREGRINFYGPGIQFEVDTTKPFTVITQFISSNGKDDGDLIGMKQFFQQNGKTVLGGDLTDAISATIKGKYSENNHFATLGGFKRMGESFKRGQVLVISLWDDSAVNMLWLDSTFPASSTATGAKRGPCDPSRGGIWWLRQTYPNSQYTVSKLQVRALSTTNPAPSPVPPPASNPAPSPVPPPASNFEFQSGDVKIQCVQCTVNL